MSRSVSAVSMARSDYCRCPPRVPTPTTSQVASASGANHTVISPRWTSARSYAGQFPTWYFVLYFGCTLDFMSRSCTCCRHDGQEVDRGAPRARDPCTNAVGRRARAEHRMADRLRLRIAGCDEAYTRGLYLARRTGFRPLPSRCRYRPVAEMSDRSRTSLDDSLSAEA